MLGRRVQLWVLAEDSIAVVAAHVCGCLLAVRGNMEGDMGVSIRNAIGLFGTAAMAAGLCTSSLAQTGDPATLMKEKLASQIKLTKAAADHSDVVAAGNMVLQRDCLVMCSPGLSRDNPDKHAGAVRHFLASNAREITSVISEMKGIVRETFVK
jgi:hypothetical protein